MKLKKQLLKAILLVTSVLSGNRNFEGRIHPLVKANYLASPPLVVAYALAGTVDIDLQNEAIGKDKDGNDVFFKDIWPSTAEINAVVNKQLHLNCSVKNMQMYLVITNFGMKSKQVMTHFISFDENSTYIQNPPFFEGLSNQNLKKLNH